MSRDNAFTALTVSGPMMRGLVLLLFALGLLGDVGIAGGEESLPPARDFNRREGVIDGKGALGIWPVTRPGSGRPADPTGFEVYVFPQDDPARWFVRPAGEWFLLPAGNYRYLLEGNGYISPFEGLVLYKPLRAERGFSAVVPVVPAGTVRVSGYQKAQYEELLHLHLFRLEATFQDRLGRELVREIPLLKAMKDGVMMPAGKVVAGIWDSVEKEYRALAPVVEVPARGSVEVIPQAPGTGEAAVVAVFRRPKPLTSLDDDVIVGLVSKDKVIQPDAVARSTSRIRAIWFSLPAGSVRVDLRSSNILVPPTEWHLRSGRVEEFDLSPVANDADLNR
jgi:hypothetical protein